MVGTFNDDEDDDSDIVQVFYDRDTLEHHGDAPPIDMSQAISCDSLQEFWDHNSLDEDDDRETDDNRE